MATHGHRPGGGLHHTLAEKEGSAAVGQPVSRDGRIPVKVLAVKARLLEEEEDEDGRGSQQADGPPELDGEESIGRDEGREGRAGDGAKQEGHMQGHEGATALMQEQQVGDDTRAQDGGHGAEKAGK